MDNGYGTEMKVMKVAVKRRFRLIATLFLKI